MCTFVAFLNIHSFHFPLGCLTWACFKMWYSCGNSQKFCGFLAVRHIPVSFIYLPMFASVCLGTKALVVPRLASFFELMSNMSLLLRCGTVVGTALNFVGFWRSDTAVSYVGYWPMFPGRQRQIWANTHPMILLCVWPPETHKIYGSSHNCTTS